MQKASYCSLPSAYANDEMAKQIAICGMPANKKIAEDYYKNITFKGEGLDGMIPLSINSLYSVSESTISGSPILEVLKSSDGYYDTDGKLEGFPNHANCFVMAYNKDMFEAAGVPVPEAGWTLKDLADCRDALQRIFQSHPLLTLLHRLRPRPR